MFRGGYNANSMPEHREWLVQVFTFFAGIATSAFVNIATELHGNRSSLRLAAMILFFAAACSCLGSVVAVQKASREAESRAVGRPAHQFTRLFWSRLGGTRAVLIVSAAIFIIFATLALVFD